MTKVGEKPKVFGAGLIALDLVLGAEPESPVRSWTGGTCGNVLSILAYLGWEAYPIARMDGDSASQRVKTDMKRWGVRLDFAGCSPTSNTPIIIQEIRRGRDGAPTHRFSWSCPRCGQWLPRFKAVTRSAVDFVAPSLPGAAVFFMDRVSRAVLTLAARASAEGAIVVFEPSGKSDPKLFVEALQLSHIVKYSDQRMSQVGGVMQDDSATLLEVQTLGSKGLRYRHRLGKTISDWTYLDAVPAPRLSDTCGSGDWCTAGLLAEAAAGGLTGFRSGGADGVGRALRYGQASAAWNCGFEGARGGMYAIDRMTFDKMIDGLLEGRPGTPIPEVKAPWSPSVACPACSPDKQRGMRPRGVSKSRPGKQVSAA